jgi:GGDEF domain-containing protein
MPADHQRDPSDPRLALLRRDAERRAWLAMSFQGTVPAAPQEMHDIDQIRARFAVLSHSAAGLTGSGLSGRAVFGSHVHAILQEEADPSEFAIGFVRVLEGAALDAAILRPMAQILREVLRPEDHLAEVRPGVFGVIAPATSGAALEELLGEAALSIASTTFFDPKAGESRAYEAEVAMGRLDGRRTVEDVFRETRRAGTFSAKGVVPLAAATSRARH